MEHLAECSVINSSQHGFTIHQREIVRNEFLLFLEEV